MTTPAGTVEAKTEIGVINFMENTNNKCTKSCYIKGFLKSLLFLCAGRFGLVTFEKMQDGDVCDNDNADERIGE